MAPALIIPRPDKEAKLGAKTNCDTNPAPADTRVLAAVIPVEGTKKAEKAPAADKAIPIGINIEAVGATGLENKPIDSSGIAKANNQEEKKEESKLMTVASPASNVEIKPPGKRGLAQAKITPNQAE